MNVTSLPDLGIERLKPFQPRSFVPQDTDFKKVSEVQALYKKLVSREIGSSAELEQWLLDRSELEAAIEQTSSVLYIRMTSQTDNPAYAEQYRQFIETTSPVIKQFNDEANKKFLKENTRFPVERKRYDIYVRTVQADSDLFVGKSIPLQTQVSLFSQEYQTVCGAMTVSFKGQDRTLPEMGKFLLEPDRALREAAWQATTQRRLKEKEKLEDLFDRMLGLRDTIARNAGCKNFCDYQFRAYHRFDYTPQDCKVYHKTVEAVVVPLWRDILKKRQKEMKLASLRPWDTSVDERGRPPLKPFQKVESLISGVRNIFEKLDPELFEQFVMMNDLGLLDLSSRKGKAPGGYQSTLPEARKPFIFMNAVGVHDDVTTLLHEAGHAFHALACAHDPLLDYRHGPMEFNEVASMGMELLAGEYLDVFYSPEEKSRARREHFEGVVHILGWVATIDAFQQWIYENPKHSREERRKVWVETFEKYSGRVVDWSGFEEAKAFLWHRQLHIFEVPFYYIEYGIAQLGALQLWVNARKDASAALKAYRHALALGGSRPLPELYKTAGLRFDFSKETIVPLMEAVQKELQ